ncbi:hypothetical protein EFR91_03310 [Lactobacillus amylovorus]|uniref:hypothetical protein n=1 Tax=Lactobacillus amylovorus TaxID=1604 RepID=UPI0021A6C0F0|nr:hypothetical protein [Lactobacillus amylovorus]MCT3595676.1 hypothetical protein [Lactobacillus amylovorus]
MRDKKKWNHVIELIHKIETKYGSIKLTPRSDPDFQQVYSILSIEKRNRRKASNGVIASKRGVIVHEVKQGHSRRYIENHCHISSATLEQILLLEAVELIPKFMYILHKDGEPDFYLRSKGLDIPKFFHVNEMASRKLNAFIEASGYQLICKKTIWDDVPLGAKYASRTHEALTKVNEEYGY